MSTGILLPGWDCRACGAFNGEAKEPLKHCRSCGRSKEAQTIRAQVLEFHRRFGQPIAGTPTAPSDERVKLRARLVAEEFFEFLASIMRDDLDMIDHARIEVLDAIEVSAVRVDMVDAADAMADLDYVVEGTRLEFGINGEPIAECVHSSNMAKVGGPTRADGKILKPEGWQAPDIWQQLVDQGWVPR